MVRPERNKIIKEDIKNKDSLWKSNQKNYSTGNAILPKTSKLGRMLRWPKYICLQRQSRILKQRLKIPPSIAIFENTADKIFTREVLKLFEKYQPLTRTEKKQRLKTLAEAKSKGTEIISEYKHQIKYGLNHVTNLIQRKKAQIVLIAHDVEPLELVIWLPTLCYKMGIPFAIIKGKAILGKLVRMKTATCVSLTKVRESDNHILETLKGRCKSQFNDRFPKLRKQWGKNMFGIKTEHRRKKEKLIKES